MHTKFATTCAHTLDIVREAVVVQQQARRLKLGERGHIHASLPLHTPAYSTKGCRLAFIMSGRASFRGRKPIRLCQ